MFTLRGHRHPLNSVAFPPRTSARLASADEHGQVIVWSLTTNRATFTYDHHDDFINHGAEQEDEQDGDEGGLRGALAVGWVDDTVIWSQGRDHSLIFKNVQNNQMVLQMSVNSIGFCKVCVFTWDTLEKETKSEEILGFVVSVGLQRDNIIDIYHLPTTYRIWRSIGVPTSMVQNTGTVMAVQLFSLPSNNDTHAQLALLAGYESGHVALFINRTTSLISKLSNAKDNHDFNFRSLLALKEGEGWELQWVEKGHREPVLDLALQPGNRYVWSVSVDHRIIRYRLDSSNSLGDIMTVYTTLVPGKSCIAHRNDGKLFAVGGWDGIATIYHTPSDEETDLTILSSLEKHKGNVASVAFSPPNNNRSEDDEDEEDDIKNILAVAGKDELISLWEYPSIT